MSSRIENANRYDVVYRRICAAIAQRGLQPRTLYIYRRVVEQFLKFASSRREPLRSCVALWRDHMVARGLQPQTVNHALSALHRAASLARLKFVHEVAWLRLRGRPRFAVPRVLGDDEIKNLIAACDGERARDLRDTAIVILGLRTGLRRSSMCSIQFGNVDLEQARIEFVDKGGRAEVVRIDEMVRDALKPWLTWLTSNGITSGSLFRSLKRGDDDGIHIGNELTPDGLRRALQSRAVAAGIAGFTPHTLRRTFTALLARSGAWHLIAAALGHRSAIARYSAWHVADVDAGAFIPGFIAARKKEQ
jgi:integrase